MYGMFNTCLCHSHFLQSSTLPRGLNIGLFKDDILLSSIFLNFRERMDDLCIICQEVKKIYLVENPSQVSLENLLTRTCQQHHFKDFSVSKFIEYWKKHKLVFSIQNVYLN